MSEAHSPTWRRGFISGLAHAKRVVETARCADVADALRIIEGERRWHINATANLGTDGGGLRLLPKVSAEKGQE